MPEYPIGHVVQHKSEPWRVVRIITNSVTLFESEDGVEPYITTESYVELKSGDGGIDFVVLSTEREVYEGPDSIIRGLEPIHYDGGRG